MNRYKAMVRLVMKITADNLSNYAMAFIFMIERLSGKNFPVKQILASSINNFRFRGGKHIVSFWKDSRPVRITRRRNRSAGAAGGPCFILEYDAPKGLQRKIASGHFRYQFAIEPTEAELDVLCCFSSLSWLTDRLLDLAGCSRSHDLTERTLLRCSTVYSAYIRLLAMELDLFEKNQPDGELFRADRSMKKRLKEMERGRKVFAGEAVQAWKNFHLRLWEVEKIDIQLDLVGQTIDTVMSSKDINHPANLRVINNMEEKIYGKLD